MKKFLLICTILLLIVTLHQQTSAQIVLNSYQSRIGAEIRYNKIKKMSIRFSPEIRLNNFNTMDKYLLKVNGRYHVLKPLYVGLLYRFVSNNREKNPTEQLHQYAIGVTYKNKFDDFRWSARVRYGNYANDEEISAYFLRYRAKINYNISNFKLTPFLAVRAFQNLTTSVFDKMRYTAGAGYKFSKKNSISLNYSLDFYLNKYENRHIIALEYRYKI